MPPGSLRLTSPRSGSGCRHSVPPCWDFPGGHSSSRRRLRVSDRWRWSTAIVSRPFGKPAGLVSAFALAVTPIFVAVSRNGTMDGQLIFVLLLALWVALKAAREQSLPWLLAAAVLIGIGFNIKMIQAFIVVPAILVVYLLGATDLPWKKQVLHLGLAVVVLLAVSLSWAVVVDSIPADQRPYIGGSGDNTVMGLIINYNGAHRLGIGESGGGPVAAPPFPQREEYRAGDR